MAQVMQEQLLATVSGKQPRAPVELLFLSLSQILLMEMLRVDGLAPPLQLLAPS
jgi:hypothetical protein